MRIYKISNIVTPPPLLVSRIMDEIRDFNSNLNMYAGGRKSVTIPVDLTSWKYGGNEILDKAEETVYKKVKEIAETWSKMLKLDNLSISGLSKENIKTMQETIQNPREKAKESIRFIYLHLTSKPNNYVYSESPANYMTRLNVLNCLTIRGGNYPYEKSVLKSIIEHELIHYSQRILTLAAGMYEDKINTYFPPPRRTRNKNKEYDPNQSHNEWVLQDIEYQSILHDLAEELKTALSYRKDEKEKENFFRSFLIQNENLSTLMALNRKKYNAIVSQLYKYYTGMKSANSN